MQRAPEQHVSAAVREASYYPFPFDSSPRCPSYENCALFKVASCLGLLIVDGDRFWAPRWPVALALVHLAYLAYIMCL